MRAPFVVLAVLGVLTWSCTTITEELPQQPTVPAGGPVVLIPGPAPGPSATPPATPAPSPAPGPNPTPTPTPPPPPSGSCSLAAGPGSNRCPRTSPSFLAEVDNAINAVVRQHPGYFNLNSQRGPGGYLVLNVPAFHDAVARNLTGGGTCAIFDGEEIAVKDSNSFSDQYDIILSSNHIRRGDGSYRATCTPAAF